MTSDKVWKESKIIPTLLWFALLTISHASLWSDIYFPQAKASYPIKISLTFSDLSMVKYFKEKFDEILVEKIDLLFCNKDEALTYTGQNNFKDCCNNLLKLSEMVVITDGKEGSYIVSEFNTIKIDTYPVQAIDSVGAGDTFAGAFLYGINNGLTNEKAGKLASALSSKVVTKLGPRLNKDIIESIKLTIE